VKGGDEPRYALVKRPEAGLSSREEVEANISNGLAALTREAARIIR
jgi:hypothetical protein